MSNYTFQKMIQHYKQAKARTAFRQQLGFWPTATDINKENESMEYPKILAICPSGSRVICDPPVLDTDNDKFILVDKFPSKKRMETDGWKMCGDHDKYGPAVRAWRKGDKNWIFVTQKETYLRIYAATLLAKELNLTKKEDRVALFSEIGTGVGEYKEYKGPLPTKGML
jgi:hypothetical protein